MEKLLIVLLPSIYLGTFIARNVLVKAKTKQPVRSSDPLLTASIIVVSLCFGVAILSTHTERFYRLMGALYVLRSGIVSYTGFVLFTASIVMGWSFSGQLGLSWRVGVHADQKTVLIQDGIYRCVRNPYFLSYYLMFVGIFLVRPSLVLGALLITAVFIFHGLVIREEAYLSTVHGSAYDRYKQSTGRYLPRFKKSDRDRQ